MEWWDCLVATCHACTPILSPVQVRFPLLDASETQAKRGTCCSVRAPSPAPGGRFCSSSTPVHSREKKLPRGSVCPSPFRTGSFPFDLGSFPNWVSLFPFQGFRFEREAKDEGSIHVVVGIGMAHVWRMAARMASPRGPVARIWRDAKLWEEAGKPRASFHAAWGRGMSTGPGDDGHGEGVPEDANAATKMRGDWRSWIETQLSEMDKDGGESGTNAQGKETGGMEMERSTDPTRGEEGAIPEPEPEPIPDVFIPRQEGFAELGRTTIVRKKDAVVVRVQEQAQEDRDGPSDAPPRLSPRRIFYPGQTYKPTELSPYSTDPLPIAQFKKKKSLVKGLDTLMPDWAGYKDTRYLTQFVSESGKLIPRRVTKVKAKIQKRLAREIKTARCMGLMPYDSKLPQFTRRKNPYTKARR